jgi:hypothetical protein
MSLSCRYRNSVITYMRCVRYTNSRSDIDGRFGKRSEARVLSCKSAKRRLRVCNNRTLFCTAPLRTHTAIMATHTQKLTQRPPHKRCDSRRFELFADQKHIYFSDDVISVGKCRRNPRSSQHTGHTAQAHGTTERTWSSRASTSCSVVPFSPFSCLSTNLAIR